MHTMPAVFIDEHDIDDSIDISQLGIDDCVAEDKSVTQSEHLGIRIGTVDNAMIALNDSDAIGGIKYDLGKARPSLLPVDAILDILKVLEYGAKKYAPGNWKKVEPKSRYFDATMRHLYAWQTGEDVDPETDLSHLSHAACCLLFLISSKLDGKEVR